VTRASASAPSVRRSRSASALSAVPITVSTLAAKLVEVFQRSSSKVAGHNVSLSLRNHHRRGRDYPRKRACLTAVHNFFLTRSNGTTVAE
jgi:hypothetical protein